MSQITEGGVTTAKPTTRERLLDAAVSSLIELGVARTTTLEVQRRSGTSRGALLHHFPTHAALLSATIQALVARNDQAIQLAEQQVGDVSDPLERAVRVLSTVSLQPTFLAELDVWSAARTDSELLVAVRDAERQARLDRERVVDSLFACVSDHPNYPAIKTLTLHFMRGLAISSVLVVHAERHERMLERWVWALRQLLEAKAP